MDRCQIRLLFPNRQSADGDLQLTLEERRSIYNDALHPAVAATVPEHVAHWPANYDVAERIARDANGQLRFHAVPIPEDSLRGFARRLLDQFPEDSELGKPLFMIEVRGTKTAYTFKVDDDEDRRIVLDKYVESLDLTEQEADNLDNWYVDVAVELSRLEHIVQWRTDAHPAILDHVCPSIDLARARRTVERSPRYFRDINGLLYSLSGFRYSPTQPIDDISHINVYTTDKTAFYQLHRGIFRPRSAEDLLPKRINALYRDIEELSAQLSACSGLDSEAQDGTARLEVHVKFASALTTIGELAEGAWNDMVVVYPDAVWW